MDTAVLLAAGRGTRMGGLTSGTPKPMLPVAGKPLLEHMLDRLRAAGFRRALIVTGYRAEQIERHFADYPMEIGYRRQETPDGTGAAAGLAREFVGEHSFLLSHGDILSEVSAYQGMRTEMERAPAADAVLGVKHVDDPYKGAAVYEKDGRITRIIEKPAPGTSTTNWNSAGLYAFRPMVFDYLDRLTPSSRGEYELTTAVEEMLGEGRLLRIHALEGAWLDVGRPDDLEAAARLV